MPVKTPRRIPVRDPLIGPALANIRIVLVETQGSWNLGSVARAMENFGVSDWVLVSPEAEINREARAMAAGAGKTLEAARIVADLQEALAGTVYGVAFCGCSATRPKDLRWLQDVVPEIQSSLAQQKVAFVFGREDRGLENQHMDLCRYVVQIPTNAQYESLNLAQAVLLALYTVYSQEMGHGQSGELREIYPEAGFEERQELFVDLEKTLVDIGLLNPRAVVTGMRHVRRVIERRELTTKEIKLLRGICRQLRWADKQSSG